MLLPCKRTLHNRRTKTMNIDNRRLRQIRMEKRIYTDQLNKAKTPHDKQIYQGKIASLNNEEKQILRRYDVII